MQKPDLPTIIVGALLALVVAAGVYVTYFRQTAELARLEKAEEAAEMKRAEMQDLLGTYTESRTVAREAMSKWRSRYKVVPDSLTSPEVVGYLNDLTQQGFETFDISVQGVQQGDSYNYYTLRVTGRGYFTSLYRFIWQVENNRDFYAVEGLNLNRIDLITEVGDRASGGVRNVSEEEEDGGERERLQVMVSFNMTINAYFGGPEGVSASGGDWRPADQDGQPKARAASLPPVPSKVLADADPDINPFFPVIMDQLPPNTQGLVDLDQANLVSIVGGEAVFRDGDGSLRKLGVGDDVYLGQITGIDATRGRVRAVLNRGGIIDDVVATLGMEDAYKGVTGTSSTAVPQQRQGGGEGGGGGAPDRQRESRARRMGSNSQGRMSQGRTSQGRTSQGRTSGRQRRQQPRRGSER